MSTPELSTEERATVDRFETGEAAPESFDATAALQRVLAMVERIETAPTSATDELWAYAIRRAVDGPSC